MNFVPSSIWLVRGAEEEGEGRGGAGEMRSKKRRAKKWEERRGLATILKTVRGGKQ